MTQLYAQPYHLFATGFYFATAEEFSVKSSELRNEFGEPVEEFEIQFIDGEAIDCALAKAIGLYQGTVGQFFTAVDAWDHQQKLVIILAVDACGYDFTEDMQPEDFDLDVYALDSLRELAEQFVEEGLFGDISERLQGYLDYEAIARDLAVDYSEAEIAGTHLVYRCG